MNIEPFFLVSYAFEDLATSAPASRTGIISLRQFALPLHDASDTQSGAKVTVVIGPNGSGKSTAVASLVDELDLISELRQRADPSSPRVREAKQTRATLEYRAEGKSYELQREGAQLSAKVDGKTEVNGIPVDPTRIPFPSKVISVAHLPADKFRFTRNEEEQPFYRYLGLRQATNLTTTGSLEASVISSILSGQRSTEYQRALAEWLRVLDIEAGLHIELLNLRTDALDIKDFSSLERVAATGTLAGRSAKEYFEQSPSARFRAVTETGLAEFFLQLQKITTVSRYAANIASKRRQSLDLSFDAIAATPLHGGLSWDTGVEILRKLRLVQAVRLVAHKGGQATPFSELSSGERQIVGTATRLFEHAANGSVIVIDEPEVSLHPSWQITYIPQLLLALRHLDSAHIVIATHSHFMVSDVGSASSLVVAQKDAQRTWSFERFPGAVFGRTPENILYRVFGVATASNFYVEHDLSRALQMISSTERVNLAELKDIRFRLDKVSGADNPAFTEILRSIDFFIARMSNAST